VNPRCSVGAAKITQIQVLSREYEGLAGWGVKTSMYIISFSEMIHSTNAECIVSKLHTHATGIECFISFGGEV
jgi:hypothetical protein